MAGAGTATGIPFWCRMLAGCLFATPSVGASSVTHALSSAGDGGSGSILGNKGQLARMRGRGARGNAVFNFEERQIPRIDWDFQSLIEGTLPLDSGSVAGLVLPTPPVGLEVNLLNTVVLLDGHVLGVRRLSIDLGNKVTFYSTTATRQILFSKDESGDRRAIVADALFELPDPATKNFFGGILTGAAVGFSLVHGTAAGNIIEITSSRAVISQPTFSQEENRVFMNCRLRFVPTAANNELTLVTR
jgi:hypothetical protein